MSYVTFISAWSIGSKLTPNKRATNRMFFYKFSHVFQRFLFLFYRFKRGTA